jgi:hypothetical protein
MLLILGPFAGAYAGYGLAVLSEKRRMWRNSSVSIGPSSADHPMRGAASPPDASSRGTHPLRRIGLTVSVVIAVVVVVLFLLLLSALSSSSY